MGTGAVVAVPRALQQPAMGTAVGPAQPRLLGWAGLGRGQGGGRAGGQLSWAGSFPVERNIRVELGYATVQREDRHCWLWIAWQRSKTGWCRREAAGLCPAGTDRPGGWSRAFVPEASLVSHVQHCPLPPGVGGHLAAGLSPSLCRAQGLCRRIQGVTASLCAPGGVLMTRGDARVLHSDVGVRWGDSWVLQ